jgi:hypothetical protein
MSLEALTMTDWVRRSGTTMTVSSRFILWLCELPLDRLNRHKRPEPHAHGAIVLIGAGGGWKHGGQLIGDFTRIGMTQVENPHDRDVLAGLVQMDDVGDHACSPAARWK